MALTPLIPATRRAARSANAGTQIQGVIWLAILSRSGVEHSARHLGPGIRRDERIVGGFSK